jgi:bifunctional DNase/RNase
MTDTGSGPTEEETRAGLDPGTWRLAVVAGVRMDMPGEHPEVLVHEAVSPWRELAIPVAMADGNAIAYAWRSMTTPRPLTHALFTEVLERHDVQLEAVRITARRGRSYFAELDTVGPRGRQIIACRPSDALALVLRQRLPTPVLVADWVFDPEVVDAPAFVVPAPVIESPASDTEGSAPPTEPIDLSTGPSSAGPSSAGPSSTGPSSADRAMTEDSGSPAP